MTFCVGYPSQGHSTLHRSGLFGSACVGAGSLFAFSPVSRQNVALIQDFHG